MCRDLTRLDGAWNKKKVWRPHIQTWGLWEANILFWKSAYGIVVSFGPPQWFGVRGIFPLPHSLRLWCYAIKIGKCSENKQIFISKRHELLFHKHLQFLNTILHGFCTKCQQRLLAAIQVSSCSFYVTSMHAPRAFLAWTCVCFANNKTLPTFNKLLFKVRSVWAQFQNCFESRFCSANVQVSLGNGENAI